MFYRYLTPLLFFMVLLTSCDSTKIKQAQETLEKFTKTYKAEDVEEMGNIYPDLLKLKGNFRKIDKIITQKAEVKKKGIVEIQANMTWENPFGKTFDYDAVFTLHPSKRNGETVYLIHSSKGFVDFKESNLYLFTQYKEPGIGSRTDAQKSELMNKHEAEFNQLKDQLRRYLSSNLTISGFSWRTGDYSNYATGRAIVTNNTKVPVPNVKYIVTYSRNGKLVTQDQGVACYHQLNAGDFAEISIYTSNVGNARQARVECYVDDENFIEQGVVAAAACQ